MGQKEGVAVPLSGGGEAGSPSNTMWPWAEVYLYTKWQLNPSSHLATTDMGRKLGRVVPLWGQGTGSPSNTMSPGPRLTSVPRGILIHRTVWPQYANVTNRQDRQTTVQ